MSKLRIIYNLLIPILIAALGSFLGSWLLIQYSQAQLIYYTDGYYQKVGDLSIGELYIVNEGRKSDENITVVITEEIPISSLAVSYISSSFHTEIKEGRTYITIKTLKPGEGAEIVFKIKSRNPGFEVESLTSEAGNISSRRWIEPWWYFTQLQVALISFIVVLFFGVGFAVGLWKNDLIRSSKYTKN